MLSLLFVLLLDTTILFAIYLLTITFFNLYHTGFFRQPTAPLLRKSRGQVKLSIALEASWPKQSRARAFWSEFTQQWSKRLVKWFMALIFLSFSMVHTDCTTSKMSLNRLSLIFTKHLHHVTEKVPLITWRQEQRTFLSKRLKTFLHRRWKLVSLQWKYVGFKSVIARPAISAKDIPYSFCLGHKYISAEKSQRKMREVWTLALPRLDNYRQLYLWPQWIGSPKFCPGQHGSFAQESFISVL